MNKELANPFNQGYKHKPKDSKLTCPICHKGFSECKHSLTAMIKEYNKIIKQVLRIFKEKILDEGGILDNGVVRYEFTIEEIDHIIKILEEKE